MLVALQTKVSLPVQNSSVVRKLASKPSCALPLKQLIPGIKQCIEKIQNSQFLMPFLFRLQAVVGHTQARVSSSSESQSDRATIRTLLDEINRTDCKVHLDVAKELQVSSLL